MSDVSDTELLNAYLDGELTAEEQARAEKMLALSGEARQLLEELRAVSGALQSLPQQKLDEDLAARVLQIAERRMLSPEEAESSAEADKPSAGRAASAGFPWREISWRGMFSPRALIWSAIIILVAVVIHYNAPPQNANRELARLDEKKPAATASVSADERKSKSASQPAFRAPADQLNRKGGDVPAIGGEGNKAVAKAEESLRMEGGAERKKLDDRELKRDRAFAQDEPAPKAAVPVRPMEESRGERTPEKRLAGEVAVKDAGRGFGGGAGALQREHPMYAKRAGPPAESLADTQAGQVAAKSPATGPAPSAAPAATPSAAAPPTVAPPAATQLAKAGTGAVESNVTAKRPEQATTTVRLNISAAALRNGTFNAVLVRNGLDPRPVLDGRQQAMGQFQNYGAGNGNFYAGNAQMPLANGATAGSPNALQQIAPQSLSAANQAQGGIARTPRPPRRRRPATGNYRQNPLPGAQRPRPEMMSMVPRPFSRIRPTPSVRARQGRLSR